MNPTQLRLDARDLAWHIDHHNERQTLRAIGATTDLANKKRSPKKKRHNTGTHGPPKSFPQALPTGTTGSSEIHKNYKHEDSIISNEAVPHNSRSFWDRVLADAGTPTRTQTTSQGNPRVIEPSNDILQNHHSSRASTEEDHTSWQDDSDDETDHSGDLRSPFRDTEAAISSERLILSSSSSLDSTRVNPSNDADDAAKEQILPSDKAVKTASAKRRLSFNFFRRKVTPDLDGNSEVNERHSVVYRVTDRHNESHWNHDRSRSESANSSSEGDPNDGMYGSRRDRRTISTNLEAYVNARSDAEGSVSQQLSNNVATRSSLPAMTSPRQLEGIPRHASGLPRSSLYISQAATSSSPHKDPETTSGYPEIPTSEGLLAYPPRRRKRYKPRSESYPFVSSEDLDISALPQLDGPSTFQHDLVDLPSLTVSYPSMHNMVLSTPPDIPASDYPHFGASPGVTPDREDYATAGLHGQVRTGTTYEWSSPHGSHQDSVEMSSYQSLSSMGSEHARNTTPHSRVGTFHPTPSRRNLSPFSEPFVPRSARRHPSPQLPLPPPFSATPRNLSLTSVLSSSSVSPHTPPPRLPSYSASPVPRSHAQIPIYNDNLSPTTQPQTPAELSRNRGPPLAIQNPFNTAPARPQGSTTRDERLADWQAFATPTRGPSVQRNFRDYEQENVGAVDAEERQLRRELARELRMGREERERGGRNEGF